MERKNSFLHSYNTYKLKDLGHIITGKTPPTKNEENFGGKYPFITIPDLNWQRYVEHTERTISDVGADKMKTIKVPSRTVMVSCLATVGEVGITTKESFTNQQINSIVCDTEKVHPEYLYYKFKRLKPYLLKYGGSVYTNISKTKFANIEIDLPPLDKQKRIASVLSAFDDKIEVNNRINAKLEEMAQAIFKEWFVHFRFPGHEQTRFVDSELGQIPEGWEVKQLNELVSTQYGYTASAQNKEVGPKFLRVTDINKGDWINWNTVPYCEIDEKNHQKYKLEYGDVVVARMGDPGKVALFERDDMDAVFASYMIRLKNQYPETLRPYFLYYYLKSSKYQNYVAYSSTGTTRKSLNAKLLVDVPIILPPREMMEEFEKQVISLRSMLNTRIKENKRLAEARDALLPKLLNGEVEV